MNQHVRNTMEIMDSSGHTTVTWDPTDETGVADARREFNRLLRDGYQAFRMEAQGDHVVVENKGERVSQFDPEAGRLLMVPQRVGG